MERDEVRELIQSASQGVLSTLDPDSGTPYGSIVDLLPVDLEQVVFLFSDLAEHTTHFEADPRSSVIVAEDLGRDRLIEHPRATLMGELEQIEDPSTYRDSYLERHPHAEQYVDFEDFRFYALEVARIRYIAGFGEMGWLRLEED